MVGKRKQKQTNKKTTFDVMLPSMAYNITTSSFSPSHGICRVGAYRIQSKLRCFQASLAYSKTLNNEVMWLSSVLNFYGCLSMWRFPERYAKNMSKMCYLNRGWFVSSSDLQINHQSNPVLPTLSLNCPKSEKYIQNGKKCHEWFFLKLQKSLVVGNTDQQV